MLKLKGYMSIFLNDILYVMKTTNTWQGGTRCLYQLANTNYIILTLIMPLTIVSY